MALAVLLRMEGKIQLTLGPKTGRTSQGQVTDAEGWDAVGDSELSGKFRRRMMKKGDITNGVKKKTPQNNTNTV